MKTAELIEEVSALPIEDRAIIVDAILKTMYRPDPAIDKKWLDIVKSRIKEMDDDPGKEVDGELVFQEIWKMLEK